MSQVLRHRSITAKLFCSQISFSERPIVRLSYTYTDPCKSCHLSFHDLCTNDCCWIFTFCLWVLVPDRLFCK